MIYNIFINKNIKKILIFLTVSYIIHTLNSTLKGEVVI